MLFGHPVLAFLGSCVELIPISIIPDNLGSTALLLLH